MKTGMTAFSDSAPRVAIVVRTQNRPGMLERALRSISQQQFTGWEAVVVNDGGDAEAVDAAIAKLPEVVRQRVQVRHSASPRGRWVSANAGVLASRAPYLVLHDDDDTWHPEFLQRAVDYLEAHPERDGVVSRIEIVWEERAGHDLVEVSREMFQDHLAAPTLSDTLLFNRYVPIGFLYRRSLHEALGLYDERLPVIGDWAFNLKVLARGPLEYLDEHPFAFWHQRVDATGAEGNSVIAAGRQHQTYDALVRDTALREYVEQHGPGLVLYLTKFIDQRLVDVERGIRSELRRENLATRALRAARRRLVR